METKIYQYKTNINCGGCISQIQSDLSNHMGIEQWSVDITTPDKILSVESKGISSEDVVEIIESKGFKAEPID